MESKKYNYIYISILFGVLSAFLVYFMVNHEIFFNKSNNKSNNKGNIDIQKQNATKALIENLASTPVEEKTINSKNKKQDDVVDIRTYLDEADTTKIDNQEKNKDDKDDKDDSKVIKDSEEAFDALLNQTPEEQKIILDSANNSNQELTKNNFIVIDPSDKEESAKKQKIDSLVSDDEPNNIKPNDTLTKSIEGVVKKSDMNDDIDVGDIESDAIEAENNTPVSDDMDTIASSIDDVIIDNKNKDTSSSVPEVIPDAINQFIGDKLSLPPELFDVPTLNSNVTQEAGIIPTDTIMGTRQRQSNNKNIDTIENKPVQQPAEPQPIPTRPKAINLENKDFKCYFKHFINMVEKTEIFKLTLTPMSQTQQPIKMQVKKDLQLYQYLNMSLENTDNYPSEFAVLKNFCKTITVEKSVSEDY